LLKIVYIPIEKKNRELNSKLLIAHALTRAGVTVILGVDRVLFSYAANFPLGMMYFKGLNKVQFEIMTTISNLGYTVVATDEEALGSSDPAYIMQDCWPGTRQIVSKIFSQGEVHRRALMDLRDFTCNQVIITGNARVDLLRPPFSNMLTAQVAAIRARHGRFVLINTDFSSVNGRFSNLDVYCQSLIDIGWIDPSKVEDVALMEDHLSYDRGNMAAVIDSSPGWTVTCRTARLSCVLIPRRIPRSGLI